MVLHWVTIIALFSYGVLFIHLGIAALVVRNKKYVHYASAALLIDFGAMCVAGGLWTYFNREGAAIGAAVFMPMVLLSPIGAAFAMECFGARKSARGLSLAIRAGTGAALAAGLALFVAGAALSIAFAIAYGWLFVTYLSVAAFEARELRPIRAMPAGLRAFFALICVDIVLVGGMFAFELLDYYPGLYVLWMALILSIFATTLIAFRSPSTYRLLESQADKIRYERSRLGNLSVGAKIAMMDRLMAEEELYRDPDLTLEELAERLGMSAPQLSELLNLHLCQAFPSYVNGLRVERAKRLLLEDAKAQILTIAFQCGFNSKSAFNVAFNKLTGTTPSDFRKCGAGGSAGK